MSQLFADVPAEPTPAKQPRPSTKKSETLARYRSAIADLRLILQDGTFKHIEGSSFCAERQIASDLLKNLTKQKFLDENRISARTRTYKANESLFTADVALLYLGPEYAPEGEPVSIQTELEIMPPAAPATPVSQPTPTPTPSLGEMIRAVMSELKADQPPFDLGEMATAAFKTATDKGFYQKPRELAAYLMEINTEVGEALDAHRKGLRANYSQESFEANMTDDEFVSAYEQYLHNTMDAEFAGILLRTLSLSKHLNINIHKITKLTMRYNRLRPLLNGKQY